MQKGIIMKKIVRFGVSLEKELLDELDELVRQREFPNRSQALRFLIRENQVKDSWQVDREVAGCLVLVYDHHRRELVSRSMELQHNYQKEILSVQHVHLDHDKCLELIALKGKASKLKQLSDRLIALKGMQHGQLAMTAIDSE